MPQKRTDVLAARLKIEHPKQVVCVRAAQSVGMLWLRGVEYVWKERAGRRDAR